ncbi:MAG: hypothetical protein WC405_07935 [Syntrophales bacterium]
MDSKKEKRLVALAAMVIISLSVSTFAYADDCDPTFKGLEVYDCKMGRVEHKIGLKKDTRPQCVEHRKLNISGCTVEALSTDPATHYLYIIGPEKTRKGFNDFKFQCDNDAGNTAGGLDKSRFEGQWAPGYTVDKFPSESNAQRHDRFITDLGKQGKAMYGGLILSQPTTKYTKKFDKQVCQFFNVKTNKVAMKFNCNVDFQEKDAAASGVTTAPAEEKKGGATDSIQKGLKGIFGK